MALDHFPPATQRELLEQLRSEELLELARTLANVLPGQLDRRAIPTRKDERVKLILLTFSSEANFTSIYRALSQNEKQTLSEIMHDPSGTRKLNHARYAAIYGKNPACITRNNLLAAFMTAAEEVPPEVAARLRPLLPALGELAARYLPGELPVSEEVWLHATEEAACHDVLAVINLLGQQGIKVSANTGVITEGSAEKLCRVLLAGDYYTAEHQPEYDDDVQIGKRGIKPFAWPLLLQAAGLASAQGNLLTLTAKGEKARTLPAHELLRTLWQRWLKYKDFHEFSRLEEIKGQKSSSKPLTVPLEAREALANTLAALEVQRWIAIDDFFTYEFALDEGFNVVRNEWALYRGDPRYGSFEEGGGWQHHNGRFAMAFLLEYCATLGIIEVGISVPWGARNDKKRLDGWEDVSCISRYDGLRYLRLTPLGAWILGLTAHYTPARPARTPSCKILPNGDIVIIRRVEPGIRLQLERLADPVSSDVYHLSKEKLLQACEEGISFAQLRTFLEEQIDHALPDTVRALLDEVDANRQKFSLESAGYLIHCADAWLITLVCNDPALKSCCLAVNDQYLYLRKGSEKTFKSTLRKLGYVLPNMPQ